MKLHLCDYKGCDELVEVADNWDHEFCCEGYMCGCGGYPINPMFCDKHEEMVFGSQTKPQANESTESA